MRSESLKKRQAWLDSKKLQEESIQKCQKQVQAMETDIAALNAKIKEIITKLANDIPYRWNPFALLFTRLSEEQKDDLRRQNLDCDAAIRIKQGPLGHEKSRLQQLRNDLAVRQSQEDERVAAEEAETERRERLMREKAAAEAQRRREAEYAQEKLAREAREEATRESAKRAEAARQEEIARERAARQAAREKRNEETAQRAKAAEATNERRSSLPQKRRPERNREPKRQKTKSTACMHKVWWDKIPGPHSCEHCDRPLYRFAYQCHKCELITCASCMRTAKT